MGQTWTANCYQSDHIANTDLLNMEVNFATLRSSFSGTGAPANAEVGLAWFDTTNDIFKIRNAANSAYYGLMHGDTSQKMWVYRNAAMAGWVVDGSVTDRVLALKTTAGGATYTTGGAAAGSWDWTHTHAIGTHTHTYTSTAHTHGSVAPQGEYGGTFSAPSQSKDGVAGLNVAAVNVVGTTDGPNTVNTGNGYSAAWRPAAAVGTLQYPKNL
jgi:hypothetical protein